MPQNAVLPSLIGRPAEAREHVRQVAVPDTLSPLVDGIQDVGRLAAKISGDMFQMKQEENELNYQEALNAYKADTNSFLNNDVYSRTGAEAAGSLERFDNNNRELVSKYSIGLDERNARRFSIEAGQFRNSNANRIMDFERGNIRGARIGSLAQNMQNDAGAYSMTGDMSFFDSTARNATELYVAQNGSVLTRAGYEKFLSDIDDGDDTFKIDGKTFHIVDAPPVVPDGRNYLLRSGVEELKSAALERVEKYESFVQNATDTLHASRIDALLKAKDVAGAELYLAQEEAGLLPAPMSDSVYAVVRAKVESERRVANTYASANAAFEEVRARGASDNLKSMGGDYLTPEAEKLALEKRSELEEAARQDTTGMAAAELNAFNQMWNAYERTATEREAIDTAAMVHHISSLGLNTEANFHMLTPFLNDLPESVIKDKLLAQHSNALSKQMGQMSKDPEVQKQMAIQRQSIKSKIMLQDVINVNGKPYTHEELRNDPQARAALWFSEGMTPDEQSHFDNWFMNPAYDSSDAAVVVAEAINGIFGWATQKGAENNPDVLKVTPNIASGILALTTLDKDLTQFAKARGLNFKDTQDKAVIKEYIQQWVINQQRTTPGFIRDKVVELKDTLKSAVSNNSALDEDALKAYNALAMTDAQARRAAEFQRDWASMRNGGMTFQMDADTYLHDRGIEKYEKKTPKRDAFMEHTKPLRYNPRGRITGADLNPSRENPWTITGNSGVKAHK